MIRLAYWRPAWLVIALTVGLACHTGAAHAGASPGVPATAIATPAPSPAEPALSVRVVSVAPKLRLKHIIEVRVDGLSDWVRTGKASPWKLVPFIDGRELSGLYPIAVDTASGTLQFLLVSSAANADTWTHLLSPLAFERTVGFSVGLEHQDALPSALDRAGGGTPMIVVDRWWSTAAISTVLVLGFALARLSMKTPLLMDVVRGVDGASSARYSLAKVQFALWFFVILSAFLVIWLTTGNFNSLNASVVAVLGISAGTAVSDNLFKLVDIRGAVAADGQVSAWRHWRAFLDDLVCDAQGHSITRFQMLAWTVILITVFLIDVFDDLRMPVMGTELLYLLGLSSGTYVAYRRPEPPSSSTTLPPSPTPPVTTAGPAAPATAAPTVVVRPPPFGN